MDKEKQRSFLLSLIADRIAATDRLIYADWLEEQDRQALAQWLRAEEQYYAAQAIPKRSKAVERMAEIHASLPFSEKLYSSPLLSYDPRPVCSDWSFTTVRGVVSLYIHNLPPHASSVAIPPNEWLDYYGHFILAVEAPDPTDYGFSLTTKSIEALLDSPLMEGCLGLDISALGVSSQAAERIAESSVSQRFASLNLSVSRMDQWGVRALARSPHLSNLLELDLSRNRIGDEAVAELLKNAGLLQLRALILREMELTRISHDWSGAKASDVS